MVSFLALGLGVAIANAAGVFTYDSVKDEFIIDGNLRTLGDFTLHAQTFNGGTGYLPPIFYLNSSKDFNIKIGSGGTSANFKFGINNNANKRIFEVDSAGNINMPADKSMITDSSVYNFGSGNFHSAGSTLIIGTNHPNINLLGSKIVANGDISITGTVIPPSIFASWGRAFELPDSKGVIWNGTNVFAHKSNGFFWSGKKGDLMSLDNNGNLIVQTDVLAKDDTGAIVPVITPPLSVTNKFVLTNNSNPALESYTHSYGGTYATSINGSCPYTNPYSSACSCPDTSYTAYLLFDAANIKFFMCYK